MIFMKYKILLNSIYKLVGKLPKDRKVMDEIYRVVLRNQTIREMIEWETPLISDLSESLELSNGQINAIRFDLLGGGIGLKKPVVGALIVKQILSRIKLGRNLNDIQGIIDGGNFNTGIALAYFSEKFGLRAALVHSRYFPDYIKILLSNRNLELIQAPKSNNGIEREFYKYLVNLIKSNELYNNFIPLWHAKYGGISILPLGEELAKIILDCPDYIVLSLGAGSNLEGIVLPIYRKFQKKPKIVIIEHNRSPLTEKKNLMELSFKYMNEYDFSYDWLTDPPSGIPHMIVGPHYDEINPLLSKDVLKEVDFVYRFSDNQWKWMSSFCMKKRIEIGNSSAANLSVSRAIADKGKNVLTLILEPLRSFYVKKNIKKILKKEIL